MGQIQEQIRKSDPLAASFSEPSKLVHLYVLTVYSFAEETAPQMH